MGILANVKKEKLSRPPRLLVGGIDGVGKTTLASQAPDPIFLGAEDGSAELEVARYPQKLDSWDAIFAALDVLETEEHAFKTVVLDTLDWAEPLCWAKVCADHGWRSMDASPFNRGYTLAVDEWRRLLAKLDRLRDRRGMVVVLIGHTTIRTFQNPEGDNFDRYVLKLHEKSASLIREWADAVLFAAWETSTVPKGEKKAMGVDSGVRLLHTERRAAFDAKNRFSLPPALPLDWTALEEAMKAGAVAPPPVLRSRIEAALAAIGDDELAPKVRAHVARVGDDARRLAEVLNKLAVKQKESNAC
jgi:hypothetical protein